MSFTPISVGTVTFTSIVPGTKTLAVQVNVPFQTFTDRLNSLTTDINAAATSINQGITGSSNVSDQQTVVAARLGGVAAGSWPNVTYTFTAEALTGMKVSRDVFFYYQFPITLTSQQPVMVMSQPRTLKYLKVKYFRNNTTPTSSVCAISVRKNGAEVGQIQMNAADANQTWIDCHTGFAGDVAFAAGDYLSLVPITIPGTGTAAQDISIILPFDETARVV